MVDVDLSMVIPCYVAPRRCLELPIQRTAQAKPRAGSERAFQGQLLGCFVFGTRSADLVVRVDPSYVWRFA